jgi:hypothetical protein
MEFSDGCEVGLMIYLKKSGEHETVTTGDSSVLSQVVHKMSLDNVERARVQHERPAAASLSPPQKPPRGYSDSRECLNLLTD